MGEKRLVPKLRFKEFEGKFKKYEFSELVNKRRQAYNPKLDKVKYECVELESLTQQTGRIVQTFNSSELKSNKTRFKKDDVLFGKLRPYLRKYWLAEFDGVCTTEIWVFNGVKVKNSFLFFLIQSSKFISEANNTSGSKMPRADWNYVSSIKYCVPTLPEQQKIASFLTAVDKKIELLEKKKALLEQYKKGVMQQLFPTSGETNPRLRFKDENGEDFPDWEEKKLGEVCDYRNGGSFEKLVVAKGDFNLITLNSIDIKGKLKSLHKQVSYSDNSLSKDDLIMVLSDVAHGNFLGLTDVIPDDNYVLNQRMGALKPKIDIDRFFLKNFINFNQKYFKLMGQGSSQQNLSKADILSFIVKIPNRKETKKISTFIASMDIELDVVTHSLTQTKNFKKGLLQQLFV